MLQPSSTSSVEEDDIWAHRYVPESLQSNQLVHVKLCHRLARLCVSPEMGHIMLHGPAGCGKTTLLQLMLKERYMKNTVPLTLHTEERTCYGRASNQKDEREEKYPEYKVTFTYGTHHAELECYSMVGQSSEFRAWIRTLLIRWQKHQLKLGNSSQLPVMMLYHVNELSAEDQIYLAQAMDLSSRSGVRFWLTASSISSMQKSLLSRVMHVAVPAPSLDELTLLMSHVTQDQLALTASIPKGSLFQLVLSQSQRQLDTTLHLLQAYCVLGSDMLHEKKSWLLPWQTQLIKLEEEVFKNLDDYVDRRFMNTLDQWAQTWFDNYYHYTSAAYPFLCNRLGKRINDPVTKMNFISDIISCVSSHKLHAQPSWQMFQTAFTCCCVNVAMCLSYMKRAHLKTVKKPLGPMCNGRCH